MKAFHFRLERVLHYFRQQELVQSMVVADIERKMRDLQSQRDAKELQKDQIEGQIRLRHQDFTEDELIGSYAHLNYLSRVIRGLEEQRSMADQQLMQERSALLDLTKRRRVVEELRSRKRAVYEGELERFEIAGIDEINARRMPALQFFRELTS